MVQTYDMDMSTSLNICLRSFHHRLFEKKCLIGMNLFVLNAIIKINHDFSINTKHLNNLFNYIPSQKYKAHLKVFYWEGWSIADLYMKKIM